MMKMTKEQILDILRKRIERTDKEWMRLIGTENASLKTLDTLDGRVKEAQDILWLLENIEFVERDEDSTIEGMQTEVMIEKIQKEKEKGKNKIAKYDVLLVIAQRLGAALDTEWADEHSSEYDLFAEMCETAYDCGSITGKEFNLLIITGLYDYDNMKKDEDEEEW